VPDDMVLWKGTALMSFAHFSTINSVISNAAELRWQSRLVFGVPMENRTPMTRRDVASEHPTLNEGCEQHSGCTPRTAPARVPEISEFKTDLHLNCNDAG
jgi:hypothetical protein